MRHFTLLAFSIAALSLSACGMISGDDAPPSADGSKKAEMKAASQPVKASAQEEKEMASLMGKAEAKTDTPADPAAPPAAVTADAPEADAPDSLAAAASAPADAGKIEDTTAADTAVERPAGPPPANAPKECPGVEVLPDTKSITYFDDPDGKPSGDMIARASLTDIKGGCDYTADGVIVDIDMIMQGRISDKGRYEGRKDLEAFMTFPYFVAVMDPDGKMVDKKILATAMRFKPEIDDLDHAEKITQNIPMADITLGPKYVITVGFQLNRAQLDYNRGSVSGGKTNKKPAGKEGAKKMPVAEESKMPAVNPNSKKAGKTSQPDVKAETKPAAKASEPSPAPKATTSDQPKTEPTPAASQPAAKSSGAKMSPIVD